MPLTLGRSGISSPSLSPLEGALDYVWMSLNSQIPFQGPNSIPTLGFFPNHTARPSEEEEFSGTSQVLGLCTRKCFPNCYRGTGFALFPQANSWVADQEEYREESEKSVVKKVRECLTTGS